MRLPAVPRREEIEPLLSFVESSLMTRLNGRQFTLQEILAHRAAGRARARQLNTTVSAGRGSLGRYGK